MYNLPAFTSEIRPGKNRKRNLPFVLVMIGPDGVEQTLATFQYANDACICGQLLANTPCPPGDWRIVARNA